MSPRVLVHALLATSDAGAVDLTAVADGGGPLEVVRGGEVTALVSRFDGDQDPIPSRAALLHHAGVVERASMAATVVPMRFGVVAPSAEDLVADVLEQRASALTRQLDRLTGCHELRLRGRYAEDEVLKLVLQRDRRAAQLRRRRGTEARLELGERMVRGIEEQREVDTERAVEALRPHTTASVRDAVAAPLDAFALAFLVPDAGRDAFEAAVDRFGEETRPLLSLELIGPMPPYSFAGDAA